MILFHEPFLFSSDLKPLIFSCSTCAVFIIDLSKTNILTMLVENFNENLLAMAYLFIYFALNLQSSIMP